MPLPSLETLTAGLNRLCADVLGEPIGYKAKNAVAYAIVAADVRYGGGAQTIAGLPVIEQKIYVRILKIDVPVKPSREVRLTFAKRPSQFFCPTNVDDDDDGDVWAFHCEEVTDG